MEHLRVLLTGIEADIAPDVACALARDGAKVTAISADRRALARLERTLSLYGVTIETQGVDPDNLSALNTLDRSMSLAGTLPQIVISCGEATSAFLAVKVLAPSLVFYAQPVSRSILSRALDQTWRPDLASLISKGPGKGLFNTRTPVSQVRIGAHLFRCDTRLGAAATTNVRSLRPNPSAVANQTLEHKEAS
ncbi:hypothetical protein BH11PSE2_BH11PSE2_21930 [soil metagenome]